MQKSNLIFSTQDIKSEPVWGIWVFVILFPIMVFLVLPKFWAYIITGLAIGMAITGFLKINQTNKSYISLYSDKILGMDIKGVSFELQYNEITRCDFQTETVQIYWNGGCYAVRTPKCEQKVINIIKQQQSIMLGGNN